MAQAYTLFAPRSLRNLYVQSMSHPSTPYLNQPIHLYLNSLEPESSEALEPAGIKGRPGTMSLQQGAEALRAPGDFILHAGRTHTQNRPHQFHPTTGKITLDTAPREYPERWFPNCQGQSLISSATFAFECCSFVLPDLKHLALGGLRKVVSSSVAGCLAGLGLGCDTTKRRPAASRWCHAAMSAGSTPSTAAILSGGIWAHSCSMISWICAGVGLKVIWLSTPLLI